MLLRDIIDRNSLMYPDRTATIWGDTRYTFLEFETRVNKLANGLAELDVVKGDRVAVLSRNTSPYIELYYALAKTGLVIVPLNYRNRENELTYIIRNSGANTLFVAEDYIEIIDSIRKEIKGVKNFISIDKKASGYLEYEAVISEGSSMDPKMDITSKEVSALIYTSGTTGRPKGAMLTQKSFLTEARNSHATISLSHRDVGMNFFPYYHVGFVRTITFMAMGATNVCADFSPQVACELIERERVTQAAMSPAQLNLFVNFPDVGTYDLGSLRKVICGGGQTSLAALKKFFEVVSNEFELIWITLGMTEACACITGKIITREMLPEIEQEMDAIKGRKSSGVTVGTAYPYCQVRVVDADDKDLPAWEVGEIIAKGDNVMKGYWRLPEATEETLRNGWLHSGDMGLLTETGDLFVVDRKKDMILSGDENIYPAEVEEVLYSHPSILEAAVIGIPDDTWGETVKAIVVLKAGVTVDESALIAFCKERLSSYKKPSSVAFVDALPRNPSGKVLKTELRKQYAGT
ncbi:MAG: AMP-binding protein [Deltaproteobacteria bacterium]|nr:AMP-binding protein [Deltaproteobacteria bacterium]